MFQEKGTKWETSLDMDGLTTNGVLIMHPKGCFSDGNADPGLWREVSIGGAIYSLRISRSAQLKGNSVRLSAVCKTPCAIRVKCTKQIFEAMLTSSRQITLIFLPLSALVSEKYMPRPYCPCIYFLKYAVQL